MARRRKAVKRAKPIDPLYNNELVAHFINQIMKDGKKTVAQKIVYGALDEISNKVEDGDPLEVFERALSNARPQVEVKSRRVGGATYQVPVEVSNARGRSLGMRWIMQYSKARRGMPMAKALCAELMDAYNNTGATVKKRDDTHKMAQANRAFAHYRW